MVPCESRYGGGGGKLVCVFVYLVYSITRDLELAGAPTASFRAGRRRRRRLAFAHSDTLNTHAAQHVAHVDRSAKIMPFVVRT